MKKLILILLILFSMLLILTMCYLRILQEDTIISNLPAEIVAEPKTIEDIIKKYNSEYLSNSDNKIYLKFSRDLFDENGKSNEQYFISLIEDLKQFFEKASFYLIDEENKIKIYIKYDIDANTYSIEINGKENFYEEIDGNSYIEVENSKIADNSNIRITNKYLRKLDLDSMYFTAIQDELGEGEDLQNGYTSYKDGTIKIRLSPAKAVRNIIFSKDYEGEITNQLKSGMSLKEVYEANSDNVFGSLSENYLGYKENNFYIFFYEDEISIYSYSYKYNSDFEKALEEYLTNNDLEKFVKKVTGRIQAYDKLEYDLENKNVYILYSNRGIEIDIKNNNAKGIKLFNNYCFTDKTKSYVKEGKISYESKDLLEKMEMERRNNQ